MANKIQEAKEKLIDRWNSKETKIGKFLKRELTIIGSSLTAFGYILDTDVIVRAMSLPQEWLPSWLPHTLAIATLVCHTVGKMTKEKDAKTN